ncbi:MAG: outer membrane protein assembly factor BamD [Candidatus Omnitrophica bacterium]|nr:outer membrane protein assembly factor BamD [Candidatus Omnitrophota bacterium]MDD5026955.1 outer membrane protein assembly factor BamD [Candidatus Omnitrophota bacterium]MDD5661811.1 outer membrane protein assembly factor BamD [Candidatus Omnitrophota bacterium]
MRRIILSFCIIFALSASPAYPFWIWTPKTGKWVNPKNAAKDSPKAQFDYALGFYAEKKYPDALREFKKLLKAYPKSFEASEAQYYLGLIEEKLDNLYEAYLAYQKVIDKYPFSERIKEIIEKEYNIAEKFIAGYKRKVLGIALPVDNPAIEILTKVVENSTYGPLAPKAEYKLGLLLKGLQRYYEAEDAFNKIITNYPDSEWVEPAKFQIASCRSAVSRGPDYDQGAMQEAKQKFEEFVREHPDAVLSKEAEENIDKLQEKEAAASYNIAVFYEKQKAYQAARIYYGNVITNYSDSPWVAKARERLQAMEKKK